MRCAAAVLVLALAVQGCTSFPFGHCDYPGHWRITWEARAVFDLLAPGEHGGFTIVQNDPEGLPFDNATLRAAWRDFRLVSVTWHGLERNVGVARENLMLNRSGGVQGLFAEARSPEEIRGTFLGFAGNLSAASEDSLSPAADAFLASKRLGAYTFEGERQVSSYAYEVPLPGPLRLEALFQETGAARQAERRREGVERDLPDEFRGGDWGFRFTHVTRTASGEVEGRPAKLGADPKGPITFNLEAREDVPAETAERALNATVQALDLARPPEASAPQFYEGPVC